ncbi:uncharacterized protein B0H18DRAFT_578735 [Fomitopsis serialis]|uniref:uncharacterized protein n=1 Tax=Fomitopsis serialis TaxID=139415 RepID=UPI0020081FDC|nr:uncharacterized protein B0H18DRAFT_578735 [Neoantrodia serialis]KAH9920942.1 hypothetical protein B0H18DRAFT_578735 [Neoantrodia serialis]
MNIVMGDIRCKLGHWRINLDKPALRQTVHGRIYPYAGMNIVRLIRQRSRTGHPPHHVKQPTEECLLALRGLSAAACGVGAGAAVGLDVRAGGLLLSTSLRQVLCEHQNRTFEILTDIVDDNAVGWCIGEWLYSRTSFIRADPCATGRSGLCKTRTKRRASRFVSHPMNRILHDPSYDLTEIACRDDQLTPPITLGGMHWQLPVPPGTP